MFEIFGNPAPKGPKEEQVYITIRVPQSLRDKFNALCEKHGMASSEALRKFITQAIAEAEAKESDAAK